MINKNIKELRKELCKGCNWACTGVFFQSNIDKIISCPCSICIVKLTCRENCERWTEWFECTMKK